MKSMCIFFLLTALFIILSSQNLQATEVLPQSLRTIPYSGIPSGEKNTPNDGNIREVWTGTLYSSTYRVGVCTRPNGIMSGVLFLQLANGNVDIYHVQGTLHGDAISAQHHSGHTFLGMLESSSKISGKITLKSGMSVSLEGTRWHQATLPEEDACF